MVIVTYITSINTPLSDISPKLPSVQEIQQGIGNGHQMSLLPNPTMLQALRGQRNFKKSWYGIGFT